MAVRPILTVPDPVLKQVSKPVDKVDDGLRLLMDDMLDTMYAAPGIGLAAIQVGVPHRLLVIDLQEEDEETGAVVRNPKVFINPEIYETSEDLSVYNEGCLSVPDQYAEVERPAVIRARWQDRTGKKFDQKIEGMLATCLQHEIDHINGVLFIDHISKLKRNMVVKKFKKAAKRGEPAKFAEDKEPSHHIG